MVGTSPAPEDDRAGRLAQLAALEGPYRFLREPGRWLLAVVVAGALARPVWVLLPFAPDWRWQLRRDDSPWYPNMTLFRQTSPGDWSETFHRVRAALKQFIQEGAG